MRVTVNQVKNLSIPYYMFRDTGLTFLSHDTNAVTEVWLNQNALYYLTVLLFPQKLTIDGFVSSQLLCCITTSTNVQLSTWETPDFTKIPRGSVTHSLEPDSETKHLETNP